MKRWTAISLALFVTVLWSTSYILNQWAFAEGIRPLTLVGLRYSLAALTLLVVRLARGQGPEPAPLEVRLRPWHYIGLGLAGYLVAQGVQYMGQLFVPPTQAGMVLAVGNSSLVLLTGAIWLKELPSSRQWAGILLALVGMGLFYFPFTLAPENLLGIGLFLVSGLGYAVQMTANRGLLSRKAADPLDLVLYPMIVGAICMLGLGLALEPWQAFSWKLAGLLLWLGPVNGALAFLLWAHSQRGLQAFESTMLNNTMMLQVALLDVLLLGRVLGGRQVAALLLTGLGILSVQMAQRRGRS